MTIVPHPIGGWEIILPDGEVVSGPHDTGLSYEDAERLLDAIENRTRTTAAHEAWLQQDGSRG